jgi:hypothetical protein
MVDLNAHEAGNGGKKPREAYSSPSLLYSENACLSRRRPQVRVPSLPPILRIGAAFVCQNVTGQITSRFLLTTAGSEMWAKPLKTCNGLLSFS